MSLGGIEPKIQRIREYFIDNFWENSPHIYTDCFDIFPDCQRVTEERYSKEGLVEVDHYFMEQDFARVISQSRRVSWRFLLPGLPPQKTVCLTDGLLAKAVKAIFQSTIESTNSDNLYPNSYDLAIADNLSPETIQAGYAFVKDGANFYGECSSYRVSSRAIVQKLDRSGFKQIGLYLAIPTKDKSSIQTWLALNSLSIIEYFLSKRIANQKNNFRSLILWLHRQAFRWLPQTFINFPWLINPRLATVTVVAIASKSNPQEFYLSEINQDFGLLERITSYFQSIPTDIDKISILMKIEQTSTDQAVLLPFINDEANPRLAVKVALGDWEDIYLEREVELLQTLAEKFPQINNIPRIAFAGRYGGNFSQAQTFIRGIPLSKVINSHNFEEIANRVTDWLIFLAQQTSITTSEKCENLGAEIINALSESMSMSHYLDLLNTTFRYLQGLNLAIRVVEHRDLGVGNIHVDANNEIGIFDWSDAVIEGIPGIDLIFFLTTLALNVEPNFKSSQLQIIYQELLNPKTAKGKLLASCCERYLTALNISISLLPQLRLLTWMIHTYLQSDETRTSSIYFSLWQEEINLPLSNFWT